jgi:hypothetical protein
VQLVGFETSQAENDSQTVGFLLGIDKHLQARPRVSRQFCFLHKKNTRETNQRAVMVRALTEGQSNSFACVLAVLADADELLDKI